MRSCIAAVAVAALLASPAAAQDPSYVPDEEIAKKALETQKEEKPQGWRFRARLGSTASFNHNRNVVGNPDGSSFQLGLLFDTGADYLRGNHEWLNSLTLAHQQSKTPLIDSWVKSMDALALASLYLYHLPNYQWMGPFGRFRLDTAILPSELVFAADTTLQPNDANGNALPPEILAAQESRELTSAFEPLILRESAGLFMRPVDSKSLSAMIKLGGGVQEIITQEGFVAADDATTTDVFELKQLQDVNQAGGEVEAQAGGAVDSRVSWTASANFLQPFYTSVDTPLSGLDLLQTELDAKMSIKLTEWGSLDYVFTAKKIPLVVDKWQVQNGLIFNAGFNLI